MDGADDDKIADGRGIRYDKTHEGPNILIRFQRMMKTVEAPPALPCGAQPWPLSLAAYHALGEAGLVPRNAELLYGFVYQKIPKSPYHCFLLTRLLRLLLAVLPEGRLLRSEQPITCDDSEPEPDLSVVRGSEYDFRLEHPKTAELVITGNPARSSSGFLPCLKHFAAVRAGGFCLGAGSR